MHGNAEPTPAASWPHGADVIPHPTTNGAGTSPLADGRRLLGLDNPCLRELPANVRIVAGRAGDHFRILALLNEYYQANLAEDFQSHLDEPAYSPTDRLLATRRGDLLGQVHVLRQFGWFAGQRIPLVALRDPAILPQWGGNGLAFDLIETAESTARLEGAVLATCRTGDAESLNERDWSVCRGQGFTRANTRTVLAHLTPLAESRQRFGSLEVRTWWHYELDAIEPLYDAAVRDNWGMLHRSNESWRWLVGRKAHDQILIALEPSDGRANGNGHSSPVVGYAVVRDARIVEMVTSDHHTQARVQLLLRACRDALDRDFHHIEVHTPATDPLHELLVTGGGSWQSDPAQLGGQWMLKLLAPDRWIERLEPLLFERARQTGIARPLELRFAVGQGGYVLNFTRRSVRLEKIDYPAQADVTCDPVAFQDLLVGNLTPGVGVSLGRLILSDPSHEATLSALFPAHHFWQSPFELLRL